MKLAHLHLVDGFGNKSTLICNLEEEEIRYFFYSGISSSGIPFALSNLQCNLPIEKNHEKETKEQFKKRLINIINKDSVYKVFKEVLPVKF